MSASCLPRHSSQSLRPRQGQAISGSKLNSQVNKVIFPHFARKLIIAATFYQLHEYNKLNLQWNKRNAIYFTVEFHAGIHLISIILGDELRYWLVNLLSNSQPSQTERGFPHEIGFLLCIKLPSLRMGTQRLISVKYLFGEANIA